jgi:cold shock CspA family protein
MDNSNYSQGFGTISFVDGSDAIFGQITAGRLVKVTVRGRRDPAVGFAATGDGVAVSCIRRHDAKPGQPVGVVKIVEVATGEEFIADLWLNEGKAFGLSAPKETKITSNW